MASGRAIQYNYVECIVLPDKAIANQIESAWHSSSQIKMSACVECGVCLERCPFDVEIIAKMREAAMLLEERAA
jgi:predicted aldo/keto reductase-like oxidoreductase